jgi:uncharacterized Zn finger protein (UPF0148 family)
MSEHCEDCGIPIMAKWDGRCYSCYLQREKQTPNEKQPSAESPANSRIELEALICEREGYIAENRYREATGDSPAYGAEHFLELAERIRALQQERKCTVFPTDIEKLKKAFRVATNKLAHVSHEDEDTIKEIIDEIATKHDVEYVDLLKALETDELPKKGKNNVKDCL